MINKFSRTEMFISTEGMDRLKNSTAAVFGVGGVESHTAEILAGCGVGHLTLVNNDTASLTDINRQSTALHNTMGQFKTRVMKDKTANICLGTQAITFEELVLPDSVENLFERMKRQMRQGSSVGYVLDAIDTVAAKLAPVGFAASHAVPVIASMDTNSKLRLELFRISDISQTSVCPLCKVIRGELKARNIRELKVCWSPKQPLTPGQTAEDTECRRATPGSISLVSFVIGLIIAGEIIRDICGLARPQTSLFVLQQFIPVLFQGRSVKPTYKLLYPQHIDDDMFTCFLRNMDGIIYLTD